MPVFKISHMIPAAALLLTAGPAFADSDGSGLDGWAQDAGVSVDKVMTYPAHAIARGEAGQAIFHVTVNRAGDVLDAKQVRRPHGSSLNVAARRVVDKADFPALPADYDSETLSFALKLKYAIATSASDARRIMRQGKVSSEQIAGKDAPSYAAIEILEADAD